MRVTVDTLVLNMCAVTVRGTNKLDGNGRPLALSWC
jgi:hypothetical protein